MRAIKKSSYRLICYLLGSILLLVVLIHVIIGIYNSFIMKNQVQDNERYHDAVEPQYIELLPMEYEFFEDKLSGWATIISCPVIEGASEDNNLKASVTFSNVDSLGEANQIMLALLDYLDSNPESKMNACLRIELNMYESYSIGSDSSVCFESIITYSGVDRIIEINLDYSLVPEEISDNYVFLDVQKVTVLGGTSLTDSQIALIEEVYPNAEIILD